MDDVLEGFEELFRGNGTAHGLVHGECVRTPPTTELWEDHLFGLGSLGIYPTVRLVQGTIDGVQLVCRWGCSDIDTHGPRGFSQEDARVHAKNVVTALDVLGHRGWVELTKSEGYHVWLFAESWVDARVMRSVLLLAHQLADVPAYEVNPKDALGATELGNYVNLPYARGWVDLTAPRVQRDGRRRCMIDLSTGEPVALPTFVQLALQGRSSHDSLHETAALYVPPPPPAPVTMRPFSGRLVDPGYRTIDGKYVPGNVDVVTSSKDIEDEELRSCVEQLSGKGFVIWRDGPNQGGRALTLFRLGVECRDDGLSPDEAMVVLVDADWRWGKFMSGVDGHTNGIRYIEDIVRKVYG